MNITKNSYALFLLVIAFVFLPFISAAQNDSTNKKIINGVQQIDTVKPTAAANDSSKRRTFNEYLITRKGIFGKLVKTLMTDTTGKDETVDIQRNDIRFQKYRGKIIRHIIIKRLNFGVPISDTAKAVSTTLTRLSNTVHHKTRERVINNNLFFSQRDSIQPFLLADNETYLRNLPYLLDAKISVVRLPEYPDSVDIIVWTKDVLSIGGDVSSVDINNTALTLSEENIDGSGDKIALKVLFDNSRTQKIGYGAEYIKRNILGTFLDAYFGYQNFNNSITGYKEENNYYAKLIRPLANVYMRWTYAFEASRHETQNMYSGDSMYYSDHRYSYSDFDLWGGLNMDASFLDKYVRGQRLRALAGLRLLSQKFDILPAKYTNVYDSRYADITGMLASISLFSQDFYKVQYIYGFGRNEDIPEGIDVGLTAGFTEKNKLRRPYLGLKFERYYFTEKKRYLDFTLRMEGSFYKNHFEDVTVLSNIDFFNLIKNFGKWKQRTFLSAGVAWQINSVLNEPLYLESTYGLPEFRNGKMGGYIRATLKGESVFYSPLSIASFRFAPFVFYNTSLFTPNNSAFADSKIYTSIGGGLRTRNESLVFGTVELRAYYFPRKNYNNQSFDIEINTNLKYKYNSQLIRRPDFIQVN